MTIWKKALCAVSMQRATYSRKFTDAFEKEHGMSIKRVHGKDNSIMITALQR
jgi:hypothetical protein